MPKALCFFGAAIAVLVLFFFGLDLAIGVPFGQSHFWMDVCFILCAAILGYLSWITLREQV